MRRTRKPTVTGLHRTSRSSPAPRATSPRTPVAKPRLASSSTGQPTRARSRTIRRLLVRASSRSMAAATSLRGGSVDQRLPTRWTSPRRSKSCSRASAFSLLMPAARAAIAVENEPGSLRSAARRRSGRSGPRTPSRCAAGAGGSAVAGRVPTRPPACGPPADRPRTGLGSRRTRRQAPARPGGRP